MDIEVELMLEVLQAELAKVGLIPDDDGDLTTLWNQVQHDRRAYTIGTMCSKFCWMNSCCGQMVDVGETDSSDMYKGSWQRRRGLPSYPTSTATPQKGICFSINNVLLPVVFIDPLLYCLSCHRVLQAGWCEAYLT